jgi:thiamine biosynthesis lipoprotein
MGTHAVFDAIGTSWKIDIEDTLSPEKEKELFDCIHKKINLFDLLYSRFRTDSWVTMLSEKTGVFDMPDDAYTLFSLYKDLYAITGGRMTPFVGQLLVDAGYDAEYSLVQKKKLSSPPAWEDVCEYTADHIVIKKPALFDFGAIGKGYLVDIVSRIIESFGITNYTVDAGGDMRHRNREKNVLSVGLEHPDDITSVIGVVYIDNASVAGSAGNRRRWGDFTHIIDPQLRISPEHIRAVWVIAKEAYIADALTTALYFVDPRKLQETYSFEYIILHEDYSVTSYFNPDTKKELYVG